MWLMCMFGQNKKYAVHLCNTCRFPKCFVSLKMLQVQKMYLLFYQKCPKLLSIGLVQFYSGGLQKASPHLYNIGVTLSIPEVHRGEWSRANNTAKEFRAEEAENVNTQRDVTGSLGIWQDQ